MQASEFGISIKGTMFPDRHLAQMDMDAGVFKRTVSNMCYSCSGDDPGTGRRLREERQHDKPHLRSECAKYTAQQRFLASRRSCSGFRQSQVQIVRIDSQLHPLSFFPSRVHTCACERARARAHDTYPRFHSIADIAAATA